MSYNSFFIILLIFLFSYFINWVIFNKKLTKKQNEITQLKKEAEIEKEQIIKAAQDTAAQIAAYTNSQINQKKIDAENHLNKIKLCIESYNQEYTEYLNLMNNIYSAKEELTNLKAKITNAETKYESERQRGLAKIRPIKARLKNAEYILSTYFTNNSSLEVNNNIIENCIKDLERLAPTIELPLKSVEYQDLKKQIKDVKREIKKLLEEYEKRYRLKSNRSIYKLMVIALQAELQNILLNLKYSNFDKSIASVTEIVEKYMTIAAEGNKTIHPTWIKFIGEIDTLFKKAVQIEYEYYVRQMQMKEEQAELKERMRQEAEERRYLLEQEKKVKKEEEKYLLEIKSIQEKMQQEVEAGTIYMLKQRISELEKLLVDVQNKKEEIINLQNGKAGFVYIISNLGSFGENVFKIGMTRRLDPQDRIDELSNASVPFRFDVHSFIFSEDAVSLENELHKRLDSQRVNKVTTRKEFFRCSIDDLENLVYEIQPTASFVKTMLAEQYRLTLQIEKENQLKEFNK